MMFVCGGFNDHHNAAVKHQLGETREEISLSQSYATESVDAQDGCFSSIFGIPMTIRGI